MRPILFIAVTASMLATAPGHAQGQSSSLFTQGQQAAPQQQQTQWQPQAQQPQQARPPRQQPQPQQQFGRQQPRPQQPAQYQPGPPPGTQNARPNHQPPAAQDTGGLSPTIAAYSYSAVRVPEPRQFAVHDLVTIVIRESTEADFRASLATEKEVNFDGAVSEFPRLQLRELLNAQVRPNEFENGRPAVGLDYNQEFDGSGDFRRQESLTGRITARVIDVKPNGNLVLEARKHIQADEEELALVLTGTCRVDDVGTDNTILSSELYDLRLTRENQGNLRSTTRKGVFTRFLETIFNF